MKLTVAAPSPVACPNPAAVDIFKHYIAYQRTEESDPLKGLSVLHTEVWMRGPLTGFYIEDKLNGFAPNIRMAYLFGEDGLQGGGTCPIEKDWRMCTAGSAGAEYATNVVQACTAQIDLRTIPAWVPSPDDQQKRQVAAQLRREIEAEWPNAQEIVVRDFNLQDPQITFYVKTPEGEYFQGCAFHAKREPPCEGWHLFGQALISSIRKWIFEKPYRLK
ncbi:MAG: hypothetical protein LAQ30_32105 [Acidobacteriia bacterium]|nr:hypothetical protein [Terriglobia bacterium]